MLFYTLDAILGGCFTVVPLHALVQGWSRGIGRRKTSVAVARLRLGGGTVVVNGRQVDQAFPDLMLRTHLLRPLLITRSACDVDIAAHVRGGGSSGQAQALSLAISRALKHLVPGTKAPLKAAGLMRRDPRIVERKKPGQPKARKSFTWVKR